MVAYSFKPYFSPQIENLSKRQTVRGDRARHGRPGEPLQLYEGLRTKHCRKIVADPVCRAVLPIVIQFNDLLDDVIASIELDGRQLHRDEIEAFAIADGFHPDRLLVGGIWMPNARRNMASFWLRAYGDIKRFSGVTVFWEPQA